MIFRLAFKSLRNRLITSLLTLFSIALGVTLYLGIERVRHGVHESFSGAISQTDLIVGARGGSIPLLLYSVFHLGNATNNIDYGSYEFFKNHPATEWVVPYSLGDSHKGFRVVATDESFYERYRFRGESRVEFEAGQKSQGIFDVVLGADVAKQLHYEVGQQIVLAHGISDGASIFEHGDKPFRVVGILKKTATPIDRALYITLEGMEAVHIDWKDGAPPIPGDEVKAEHLQKEAIQVKQLTAFLLRTKSRIDALRLQREVLDYPHEPLMAIIPGVALSELWNGISYAEDALRVVSIFVVLVGILGLLVSLLTSLNERRREMAILRVMGAGAFRIMSLLILETSLLTIGGILLGIFLVYGGLSLSQSAIESYFSLYIPIGGLKADDIAYLCSLILGSIIVGMIPAITAYRRSLSDGLSLRI